MSVIKNNYRYIWKIIQDMEKSGLNVSKMKFKTLEKDMSAYMEISETFLNYDYMEENSEISVNAYYRFSDIFSPILDFINEKTESLKKTLDNIVLHFLARLDLKEGINHRYIIIKKIIRKIEQGLYGEKIKENIKYFSKKEKMLLGGYIIDYYTYDNTLNIFCKALKVIFRDSVFYTDKYNYKKMYIYINKEKSIENKAKIEVLRDFFLLLEYEPQIMWKNHCGVLDIEETLIIGEMMII